MGKTDLALTVYLYRDKAAFAQQLEQPFVTGGIANPDIFEFKPLAYVFFE